MKFICVIPARKGSKSIKNKNIIKIKKKPLIQFTFDQIKKSNLALKNTYLISNDKRIKTLAKKNNINVDYERPDRLSNSKTPLLKTLKHFVNWTENKQIKYDYILILQPTSPLRSSSDINNSIRIVQKNNSECLVSLSESLEHPYETVFFDKKKRLNFFFKKSIKYSRRQDFDKSSYFINGAIYITSKSLIKRDKLINYDASDFLFMSKINSLDLNDYSELKILNKILN